VKLKNCLNNSFLMSVNPGDSFSFEVSYRENGERLDAVVSEKISGVSRSQIASLIKSCQVKIDNADKKPGYRVREGETVTGFLPFPTEYSCEAEDIEIEAIYEDNDLIVVNKPAGLVVHPSPGHESGTLVNALLSKCPDLQGIGGELRPGIVHRLDKDTSGLMVAAKNQITHNALIDMFKERAISKKYLAIAAGNLLADSGIIDSSIGRHPVERKKMSVVSKTGRSALTLWNVKERYGDAVLLEVEIKTGRTHQIRVHLDSIGRPVVGDSVYGAKKNAALKKIIGSASFPKRQMLHSWNLSFCHPITKETLEFHTELPQDMTDFILSLKQRMDLE